MNAVDDGCALAFQRFGCRYICLDHEFFNEPVRGQPLRYVDTFDLTLVVEHNLALGQIKVQRFAAVTGSLKNS